MAAKTLRFTKAREGWLKPASVHTREMVDEMRAGEDLVVQVIDPRNMAAHRAYFAMLDHVVEATGLWSSREALEYEIAKALKAGKMILLRDGGSYFKPDSRAVASMSAERFARLHHDTVALLTDWLGCDPDEFRRFEQVVPNG